MKINENMLKVILLFLAVLFLIGFTYLTEEIEKITDTVTKLEQKIEILKEDQSVTKGILDAHLTNTLSLDMGGGEE